MTLSSEAQQFNPFYSHYSKFNPEAKDNLYFRFENLNFVKNNEYNGDFVKGVTHIGYIASPKLIYYPTSDFRIEAGVRLQKYSGRTNFSESEPIFSVHYQANKNLSLILGSLNQEDNHHLHEAIFEPERYFTDNAENGIQAIYNSKSLNVDTWINWEQFIFQDDPFNEVFTFGLTADMQLNNTDSDFSLKLPVQVLFSHRGGEIDASDKNKQTIRNLVTGLSLTKKLHNSRFKSYQLEALSLQFKDNSSSGEFGYNSGSALHFRLGANTKHSDIKIGYWAGNKFNSSRGSALFQSSSVFDEKILVSHINMFTAKYRIQKSISKGILVGGQVDAYLDVSFITDLSYAASVFVRINGEFFLKKLKWN